MPEGKNKRGKSERGEKVQGESVRVKSARDRRHEGKSTSERKCEWGKSVRGKKA